jgi:hypothetical protein
MHIRLLVYFNSIVCNNFTKAKLKEICLTFLLWPITMEVQYIECWYRVWKCWVASFKETNLQHVSDFCYIFDPVYSSSTKMCYHNFSTFFDATMWNRAKIYWMLIHGMKMFSTEIQSKKFPICIRHLINFSSAVLGHKQNVLELFLSTFLMRPCGIELKYIECWYRVRKCLVASFKETNF